MKPAAPKQKPRTFKVWVVMSHDDWVYVERDRGEAIRSINRPAGESVVEATLTVKGRGRERKN